MEEHNILKPSYRLYSAIEKCVDNDLSEEDIKKIAVSVIDVLREHELTYDQCYKILDVTTSTLQKMSKAVHL